MFELLKYYLDFPVILDGHFPVSTEGGFLQERVKAFKSPVTKYFVHH
jgi:hypothetical protein